MRAPPSLQASNSADFSKLMKLSCACAPTCPPQHSCQTSLTPCVVRCVAGDAGRLPLVLVHEHDGSRLIVAVSDEIGKACATPYYALLHCTPPKDCAELQSGRMCTGPRPRCSHPSPHAMGRLYAALRVLRTPLRLLAACTHVESMDAPVKARRLWRYSGACCAEHEKMGMGLFTVGVHRTDQHDGTECVGASEKGSESSVPRSTSVLSKSKRAFYFICLSASVPLPAGSGSAES